MRYVTNGYEPKERCKVIYSPKVLNGGIMGVALVESSDHPDAIYTFQQLYAGQYSTIQSYEKLLK